MNCGKPTSETSVEGNPKPEEWCCQSRLKPPHRLRLFEYSFAGQKGSLCVFSPFFGIFHAARRLKYGPKICPANRSDCKEIEPSDLACASGLSGVDSRFNRTTCSGAQLERIVSAIRLPAIENRRASFRVLRGIRDNRAWHSFACGKCFAVPADVLHRAGLRDIRKVVRRGGPGSLGFAFVEPPEDHFSGSGLVN